MSVAGLSAASAAGPSPAARPAGSVPGVEGSPPSVADQLARGARLYAAGCATARCHGAHGEGIRSGEGFQVWPLVGPGFQRRNPNAQVIFDVVRSGSERSLRAMTDQQIYDAIAYELSLNGARLQSVLTGGHAADVASGPAASDSRPDPLHPPPRGVRFSPSSAAPRAPPHAAGNSHLRLRIDQMARATAIGHRSAPAGGAFALVVIALQDSTDRPIAVEPRRLRLRTSAGAKLEPGDLDLEYAVERLRPQTISPGHGTAAVAVFALPAGATPVELTYDDGTGHALSVELAAE
jgi:hypothetical protein